MKIAQAWPYQGDEKKLVLDNYKKQRKMSMVLCTVGLASGSVLLATGLKKQPGIELTKILLGTVCFFGASLYGLKFIKQNQLVAHLREEIESENFDNKLNRKKVWK